MELPFLLFIARNCVEIIMIKHFVAAPWTRLWCWLSLRGSLPRIPCGWWSAAQNQTAKSSKRSPWPQLLGLLSWASLGSLWSWFTSPSTTLLCKSSFPLFFAHWGIFTTLSSSFYNFSYFLCLDFPTWLDSHFSECQKHCSPHGNSIIIIATACADTLFL